jgi:hypothetical protein
MVVMRTAVALTGVEAPRVPVLDEANAKGKMTAGEAELVVGKSGRENLVEDFLIKVGDNMRGVGNTEENMELGVAVNEIVVILGWG